MEYKNKLFFPVRVKIQIVPVTTWVGPCFYYFSCIFFHVNKEKNIGKIRKNLEKNREENKKIASKSIRTNYFNQSRYFC